MARRITYHLIDDLDSSSILEGAGETIEFTVRGTTYEIDLSAANAARFDSALKPFIDAARQIRTKRAPSTTSPAAQEKELRTAIRHWAREQGYAVGTRGSINAEILAAFYAR